MNDERPEQPSTAVTRLAAIVRVLVALAALMTVVLVWWFIRHDRATREVAGFDRSVAIVPFALVASDTGYADLGERMALEIAQTLSRVQGLRLAESRSMAHYADTSVRGQSIGAALGVSTVLRGTVQQAGTRVRVSAEFLNAQDGRVLWSQKYDRDARIRYMIQDEIARAVVAQLQLEWPGAIVPELDPSFP
jgi:TolB-like protein